MKGIVFKIIIGIVIVATIGVGGYFVFQLQNNQSEEQKEDQKNRKEIETEEQREFSEGRAWVYNEDDNMYYVINEQGKVLFGIEKGDSESEELLGKVEEFKSGYSIVTYRENLGRIYKKIIKENGDIVLSESNSNNTNSNIKFLTEIDNMGYILISKNGEIKVVNLNTGEETKKIQLSDGYDSEFVPKGSGVFYNKYYGYYSAEAQGFLALTDLEIYKYNSTLRRNMFQESKYFSTEFIDGKALFINGSTVYVVSNNDEVKQIDKLKGFKIGYKLSGKHVMQNTYNGETFYAKNDKTKEAGFYDLEGNKVIDLSNYDISDLTKMVNNRVLIELDTENLNKREVTVVDKEKQQLFEPIKDVSIDNAKLRK